MYFVWNQQRVTEESGWVERIANYETDVQENGTSKFAGENKIARRVKIKYLCTYKL